MRPALAALAFLARHFLFVIFAIAAGCAAWTVLYFGLLLIAIFTGTGIGSPLALPTGIILIIGTGMIVGWGVFAPACALGEVFRRMANLPRFAAIPVVFLAGLLSYFGYFAFIKNLTTHSMPPVTKVALFYLIYLSVPLGVYWWLTEGPGALFDTFRNWLRKRRIKSDLHHPTHPSKAGTPVE
jgi:hypothetical protein